MHNLKKHPSWCFWLVAKQVKEARTQVAGDSAWARQRSRRCSTSAVIQTASPRCSHGGGPKDRKVKPWCITENCHYILFIFFHHQERHGKLTKDLGV